MNWSSVRTKPLIHKSVALALREWRLWVLATPIMTVELVNRLAFHHGAQELLLPMTVGERVDLLATMLLRTAMLVALSRAALTSFHGRQVTFTEAFRAVQSNAVSVLVFGSLMWGYSMLEWQALIVAHGNVGASLVAVTAGWVFVVSCYFVVPILAREKRDPVSALRRTLQLLRTIWWFRMRGLLGVAWRVILLGVTASLVVSMVVSVVSGNHLDVSTHRVLEFGVPLLGMALVVFDQLFDASAYIMATEGVVPLEGLESMTST
jgi:hypothetical protein